MCTECFFFAAEGDPYCFLLPAVGGSYCPDEQQWPKPKVFFNNYCKWKLKEANKRGKTSCST